MAGGPDDNKVPSKLYFYLNLTWCSYQATIIYGVPTKQQ